MKNRLKKRWPVWLGIILAAWGIHDLVLVLSSVFVQGSLSLPGIVDLIGQRLTEPGDAVRYLDIAKNGYTAVGENAINLVFYPLYPYLIRFLSLIVPNRALSGLIISRVSFAGAAVLLYEWILYERKCTADAWLGVMLLSLYPFSVFVLGVYSESLFLVLTIGCLFLLRKKRFVCAGIAGFLAALCRVQGMLLILPAAYEMLSLRLGDEKRRFSPKDLSVLLIPAGFGVYLLINYALHGNPFQFLQYEAGEPWYQTTHWISRNIALQYSLSRQHQGLSWIIYLPQIALYFLALCTMLLGVKEKTPVSVILYGGAYLGFTFLSGWMISGGRYMLSCVPIYLILSSVKSASARRLLVLAFALTNVVYSLLFYMSYAIM